MPKFDSPIASKQIKTQPMREVSVPDETGFTPPQQQFPTSSQQQPHQHRHFEETPPHFDPQALRDFGASMQPQPPHPQIRQLSEVEQQILEAKRLKREGKERLTDGARRRIEMLIGMTRLTKDVEIDGQVYKLQTLKSKELRDALVATTEFDGTVQLVFETRKQLLGRSLVVVAGVDIEQFLNSTDLQDRLDFIEEMPHELLVRLYNEYVTLANEAQDKYTLKTIAEVKEVVEDLKK